MKRNRPLNQEKREAIVKAAIAEFYDKGYEGASMDTISKEANVSKATVYNHFKNKEELFLAITMILKERFEGSFEYTYTKEKSLHVQLAEMAKKEMDFLSLEENIILIQIVTIVLIQKSKIGQMLMSQMKEENVCMASDWFKEAQKDGKLKEEDTEFMARQFIGHMKSFAFYPQLYGAPLLSPKEQKKVIEKSVELILSLYKV